DELGAVVAVVLDEHRAVLQLVDLDLRLDVAVEELVRDVELPVPARGRRRGVERRVLAIADLEVLAALVGEAELLAELGAAAAGAWPGARRILLGTRRGAVSAPLRHVRRQRPGRGDPAPTPNRAVLPTVSSKPRAETAKPALAGWVTRGCLSARFSGLCLLS